MKVLIDTNILLDFYCKRPRYYDAAEEIMNLCMLKSVDGCIAAHSVTNAFYILRKEMTLEMRRSTLKDLCTIITVVGIDKKQTDSRT